MMEIRVAVEEGAVHALIRRLVAVFGHAAVSFDTACNEVRVRSDWGSRAVDLILSEVESGLKEDGAGSATVAIGPMAYRVVAP